MALLDTSVVIALKGLAAAQLPEQPAISALTLAELAAGSRATDQRSHSMLNASRGCVDGSAGGAMG